MGVEWIWSLDSFENILKNAIPPSVIKINCCLSGDLKNKEVVVCIKMVDEYTSITPQKAAHAKTALGKG